MSAKPPDDSPPDPFALTEGADRGRSDTQQHLHDDVKAALFEPRSSVGPSTGSVLGGRYRIVASLGRGGMGEVYRAYDLELNQEVAIKMIAKRYSDDPRFMERFVREVRVARTVTHANVCRVHDIGAADDRRFLSMEYIDGEDLASLLRRIGRIPVEKAVLMARHLCAGLAALHEAGVVHRDLKPANIMVDGEGRLKITDFGLAVPEAAITATEARDGTPAYMSPEQAQGGEVTARSDLYALGLVLYELVSGTRRQRESESASVTTNASPARRLSSRFRELPPEIDDIIDACVTADPSRRPTSAVAVAAMLPGGDPVAAALAAGRAPAVDALLVGGAQGTVSRRWGTVALVAAAVALIVALTTFGRATVLGQARSELTPSVLVHQALTRLANHVRPEDLTHVFFDIDEDPIPRRQYETIKRDADNDARPSLLRLQLRTSELPFLPVRTLTMTDPPPRRPGSSQIAMDGYGRLRLLRIVPWDTTGTADDEPDFSTVFEAAGLDASAMVPVDVEEDPPDHADHVFAWDADLSWLGGPVRIEAASRRGHVTHFRVVPRWEAKTVGGPTDTAAAERGGRIGAAWAGAVLVLFCGIIAYEARRSVIRGEADVAGAIRVAGVYAVAQIVVVLGEVLTGEAAFASMSLQMSISLGSAVMVFALYVAIEPRCRKRLPGSLVAWVRLFRGRWRDPIVGRDVLVGVTLGLLTFAGVSVVATQFPVQWIEFHRPHQGLTALVTGLAATMSQRFVGAATLFLFFFALLAVLRRPWVVVASAVVFGGLVFGAASLAETVQPDRFHGSAFGFGAITVIKLCASFAVIARFGLLATFVFSFVYKLLSSYPPSLDLGVWYGSGSAMSVLVVLALLAYGYRVSGRAKT